MYTQQKLRFANIFIPFLRQIFTWVLLKILPDTNVKTGEYIFKIN